MKEEKEVSRPYSSFLTKVTRNLKTVEFWKETKTVCLYSHRLFQICKKAYLLIVCTRPAIRFSMLNFDIFFVLVDTSLFIRLV